jgi:mono/diheme cytochrome c family protein
MLDQAGSADKHILDPVAAERGKKVYIAECITCHGASARGGSVPPNDGPDLVRSLTVLHDRYGSTIGPFIRKGHPMQSGKPAASISQTDVEDLADFLHLKVADTMRTSPLFHAQNVLVGNAAAGEAYFKGEGKCSQCHSVSGDLKGYGSKYEAIDIQQRFLFPRPGGRGGRGGRGGGAPAGKPIMVTVTPASGPPVTGVIDRIDDFNVSLRDKDGEYHAFARSSKVKVVVDDPYKAHAELLDRITDQNMHDVTAYLEGQK